jgi:hypothetical protein
MKKEKSNMPSQDLSNPGFEEIFKQKIGLSYTQNLEIVYETLTMVVLKSHTTLDALSNLWKGINILKKELGFRFEKLIDNPERFYVVMTKPSYC